MGNFTGIILMLVLFALMYFLMIRPQKKQQKKHANLLQKLNKGDHVVTIGRLHGVVDSIDRKKQIINLNCDGVYLKFDLRAIASLEDADSKETAKAKK